MADAPDWAQTDTPPDWAAEPEKPAGETLTEVTKAGQRGLMEGADTLRTLGNPVAMFEKAPYQPIARLANYLNPDLDLPSHFLPNVSDLAAKVAPGYEQG